jgi:hypothetical protein
VRSRTTLCELKTIDLLPGALGEAESRLAAAPAIGPSGERLAASLHTEIGPLNQVVQLWQHEGLEKDWRPPVSRLGETGRTPGLDGLELSSRSEMLVPLPFSPPLVPGAAGPWFELRIYRYAEPVDLDRLIAAWQAALPGRLARGPLTGVWRSADAGARQWIHLWPYRSLDQRAEVRREVRAAGVWPPGRVAEQLGLPPFRLLRQESKILVPAPFSPLQ